eukprot:scaffold13288_cov47-Cyclotella_meneghiniana.AAC.7
MANHATSSKTTAALTSFAKRIPVKIQDQQEELASFPVSSNSDWSVTWAITKNPVQKASIALATYTGHSGKIGTSGSNNSRFKLGTKIGECVKQVGIGSLCDSPYGCIDTYTCIGAGGIEIGGHPHATGAIEGPAATLRWNVQVEKGQCIGFAHPRSDTINQSKRSEVQPYGTIKDEVVAVVVIATVVIITVSRVREGIIMELEGSQNRVGRETEWRWKRDGIAVEGSWELVRQWMGGLTGNEKALAGACLGLMFLRDSPEFLQIPLLSFPQQSAAVATPPHQDLNHPNLP